MSITAIDKSSMAAIQLSEVGVKLVLINMDLWSYLV
jgi:hypothetical protein